jgi:hypothetical protein
VTTYGKLFAFADESASHDPQTPTFVVAVVIVPGPSLEAAERRIEDLEMSSKRGAKKWCDTTDLSQRAAYLGGLGGVASVGTVFYWRAYPDNRDQNVKMADTIATSILQSDPDERTRRYITVDGDVPDAKKSRMLDRLKSRGIQRKELRGSRDESSPFVRLADALAGFLRQLEARDRYAVDLWPSVKDLFKPV